MPSGCVDSEMAFTTAAPILGIHWDIDRFVRRKALPRLRRRCHLPSGRRCHLFTCGLAMYLTEGGQVGRHAAMNWEPGGIQGRHRQRD
jgi:hypothetical protein